MYSFILTWNSSFLTVPSMPLNYQLSAVSSSVLLGNWTAPSTPNGIVTNYTVYCRKWQNQTYPEQIPSNPLNYTVFIVSSQPFVYLSDLTAFTFYQCYVTASTSAGEGNSSTSTWHRLLKQVCVPIYRFYNHFFILLHVYVLIYVLHCAL